MTSRCLRRAAISAALLATAALLAQPAGAQTEDERRRARELGDEAKEALARRDYTAAAELFRKAASLVAAPTLEIGLARAEIGLGHLVAARSVYARVIERPLDPGAPPAFVKAVKEASTELAQLEARLPSVIITVRGPSSAEVTLDGAPLPQNEIGTKRFIDPGKHVARASAPSFGAVDSTFTASEGAVSEVQLELVSGGSTPIQVMVGFGLVGLGVGALAIGGVMGGFALRDRAELGKVCPRGGCSEAERGKLEAYRRESLIAWPALATGAVGIGVGTTLVLLSNRRGAVLPRKLGPALIGAGVGGISLGAVTGIVALKANSDSAVPCTPQACQDRTSRVRETGTVAIVSLAAGGAATVSGALLVALKKDEPAPPSGAASVVPEIGPGMVGLSGRF